MEAEEILFGQAAGNVVLSIDAALQIAFVGTDEAHHIKRAIMSR